MTGLPPPTLTVVFDVDSGPMIDLVRRRCIPVMKCEETKDYRATVLSDEADWQVMSADGTIDIDAHYILKLAEGRV